MIDMGSENNKLDKVLMLLKFDRNELERMNIYNDLLRACNGLSIREAIDKVSMFLMDNGFKL